MADEQPKRKNPLGATGKTVAANVKRLREDRRLAFTELAAILDGLGRPIPTLGLRHIESEKRRVDSDDLVALAGALDVSPITLLMPHVKNGRDEVRVTGIESPVGPDEVWFWLRGDQSLFDDRLPLVFQSASWPEWRLRQQIEQDKKLQEAWISARRAEVAAGMDDPDRAKKLAEAFGVDDGDD